ATYWVYHEAGADLSVTLPAGATIVGIAIDGISVPPLQPEADRLWLPLPGGTGVRRLSLRWIYTGDKEQFDVPILAGPRLEGVSEGPSVWTVSVPAGYQGGRRSAAAKGAAEPAKTLSAPAMDLTRAAAQLRLIALLVDRSRESGDSSLASPLVVAQERFE